MHYFGDTYDITKQSLLRWLQPFGPWRVHPVFTELVADEDARAFAKFLNAPLLTQSILHDQTDRQEYFAPTRDKGNVFLDPDTGIRVKPTKSLRAPEYIFGPELIEICNARPNDLTLVFDQSVGRGKERYHLACKLEYFRKNGIFGSAYVSHACFLLLSMNIELLEHAVDTIVKESKLPGSRFLCCAMDSPA